MVAYLGLDPKVKQSGEAPARSGRISKRGSASARWALVEAAWTAVLQPGPLHAFYERTRARRGHGKAIVATARKLTVLFWCMLTRGRGLRPPTTLADEKEAPPPGDHRRRTEIHARVPAGSGAPTTPSAKPNARSPQQAEASYKRMVQDQRAGGPARKVGASVTVEHA